MTTNNATLDSSSLTSPATAFSGGQAKRTNAGTYVGSSRLGIWLTVLLGLPVLGFFCFAAFSPATLAVAIVPGKPVTWWFAYGLGLIFVALDPPTLISMPLAFAVCIGVSLLDRSRQAAADRAGYDAQHDSAGGGALAAAE